MLGHQGKQVFIITTQNYKIPEGEFFVKKVMSWEGVWFEVTVTLQLTSNQTCS